MKNFKFIKWLVLPFVLIALTAQTRAEDVRVTITRSSVTTETLAYGTDADWSQGAIAGKCQVTANASCLQFNGSKPNGTEGTGDGQVTKSRRIWNTTATPRRIKSIKVTAYQTTYRKWHLYCSTSAATSTSTTSYGTQIGTEQTPDGDGYTWTISTGDYTYFMLYENEGAASYIASIEVTYEGAPAVTHTVRWFDNSGQIKSESIAEGSTSYSCPSPAPTTAAPNCGDKFMGWTTTASYTGNTPPAVLFTDDSGTKPAISGDTDFYAVFADEK